MTLISMAVQDAPEGENLHSILEAVLSVETAGIEWFFHIALKGGVCEFDICQSLSEAQGQRKND